jgi:ubiquinone/menaquinone biosynthesis C-methylase UbiE
VSQPEPRRSSAAVPPTRVDANRLWVDARLRAAVQARFEARVLRQLGGTVPGGRVLELGTGRRGTGLRLAVQTFGAAHADGVELHPASVQACRDAVRDLGDRVHVEQGDATRLTAADGSYDAVFGYHVLHHTDAWRAAVAEVARVLRPGGRFYSCEMTARIVDSRPLRAVSFHPADGDRPTPDTLAAACRAAGLRVQAQQTRFAGCWTALVAVKE